MLNAAITGLGAAGLTRQVTPPAEALAVAAALAACRDAMLDPSVIDGLVVCRSGLATEADLGLGLQRQLGLYDLRLLHTHYVEGASAVAAIQIGAMAVSLNAARHVVVVFADAPLTPGVAGREAFSRRKNASGIEGLRYAAGLFGGVSVHAMAARRYLEQYAVRPEQLAHVAISARRWAALNPDAIFRDPLSVADYLAARWVVEPLRVFDCAVPVNGAVAIIVSRADMANALARPPVHIRGFAQCHPGALDQRGFERGVASGAHLAGAAALAMAGLELKDMDFLQTYDAFSYMTLLTLEDYGVCARGEAKDFVASGAIAPGGSLPVNTGGGHLSAFYMQGMTPVHEAVMQLRGAAGARQLTKRDFALVANDGGRLDHHACLILSPHGESA